MVEELNADTKAALKEQGGIVDSDEAAKAEAAKAAEAAAKLEAEKAAEITIKPVESELNQAVNKTLLSAGYDEEAILARVTKDKGISDEFVEELKGKVDPDFIDAHVGRLRAEFELAKVKESGKLDEANVKAKATQDMNQHIFDTVGGVDKFNTLSETLKGALSTEELAAINVKLASGNKIVVNETLELAVKKYNDIRGMGGKLMEGDAGHGGDPKEHVTKEEYRALMRTEKYKTDPVYARKVDADRLKTREQDSIQYGAGQYYGFHPEKGRYSL